MINWPWKKKEPEVEETFDVTCSRCGSVLKISKSNPPDTVVCPNCGREGPLRYAGGGD